MHITMRAEVKMSEGINKRVKKGGGVRAHKRSNGKNSRMYGRGGTGGDMERLGS